MFKISLHSNNTKRAAIRRIFLLMMVFTSVAVAAFRHGRPMQEDPNIRVMRWTVGSTDRNAMIYIPASATLKPTPVVFVFHGHGGNMANMFRSRGFEKLWPEAIIVSPQGLNTPGQLTDPEGKLPGWQKHLVI